MATQRSLTVTTRVTLDPATGDHRLQAWISAYTDMDPNVFVHQLFPAVGSSPAEDRFVNWASVADLADRPIGAPGPDSPFFRTSSMDLVYRSVALLDNAVATMKTDLTNLIANLDRMDLVGDNQTYTITGKVIP